MGVQPVKPAKDKFRVLFLCTGNACRSQMAEAMLRHDAGELFTVFSAGSHPAGYIHALATETMKAMGIPMKDQWSKSWDEFTGGEMDLIVTLCDHAAGTPCPVWPGNPLRVHWSLPDPSFREGTPTERLAFARQIAEDLRAKLDTLTDLVQQGVRGEALQQELCKLAE